MKIKHSTKVSKNENELRRGDTENNRTQTSEKKKNLCIKIVNSKQTFTQISYLVWRKCDNYCNLNVDANDIFILLYYCCIKF